MQSFSRPSSSLTLGLVSFVFLTQYVFPTLSVSSAFANWPWSYATIQPFAFPGAAPRFMTTDEEEYFSANFANILIWGVNATCIDPVTSQPIPADCPTNGSHCWCNQSHPETQQWVLNMEQSLQAQGQRLQATRAASNNSQQAFPILGYIEGLSAQQYYTNQAMIMNNPNYTDYLLHVQSKGLIDCYRDGCNWQGVEYRQYDLRQPAVRDYYVQQVIGGLINGTGLNGTFIDVIDWWISACGEWPCTSEEMNDLVNASLLALDQALLGASQAGKVLSVSSHTTLQTQSDYYHQQTALLQKHGNGIRFWEFFAPTEENLLSLIYETEVLQLPTHVHVTDRTLVPDWLELSVFLLGMGNYSYFSYSGPWNFNSFAIYPEYTKPLGNPLTNAMNVSKLIPWNSWQLIPNENIVYSYPSCNNCSIYNKLAFMGLTTTAEACLALITPNASFTGMSWVPNDNEKEWEYTCWGRMDSFDAASCINNQNMDAPCYASYEAGHVSAVKQPFNRSVSTWTRSFEYLDVEWIVNDGNATLNWHN